MPRNKRGFTLIELLVVIVIISIVAGVAILTLSRTPRRAAHHTASTFVNELRLAEQQSLLQPAILGLSISDDGWQYLIFAPDQNLDDDMNKSQWHALNQTSLPAQHWPHGVSATLMMHGAIVAPSDTPQIIISPGGELTPFTLLLDNVIKITAETNGAIHVKE